MIIMVYRSKQTTNEMGNTFKCFKPATSHTTIPVNEDISIHSNSSTIIDGITQRLEMSKTSLRNRKSIDVELEFIELKKDINTLLLRFIDQLKFVTITQQEMTTLVEENEHLKTSITCSRNKLSDLITENVNLKMQNERLRFSYGMLVSGNGSSEDYTALDDIHVTELNRGSHVN